MFFLLDLCIYESVYFIINRGRIYIKILFDYCYIDNLKFCNICNILIEIWYILFFKK